MQKGLAFALVAAGALIGYTLRPVPTSAQTGFQPFAAGQKVRLFGKFSTGAPSLNCTVTGLNTEFVACAADGQFAPRWVNLRFVEEITPVPQP